MVYEQKPIKFGTDGWRGVIADDFTFENVRKVSQAIAEHIQKTEDRRQKTEVIVGYDRRFLSESYAKAVCEVLAGNSIKVLLAHEPVPTPCATMAIKDHKLSGGIIITASHNPAHFNGIKFKTKDAVSADGSETRKIEEIIKTCSPKSMNFDDALKNGLIKTLDICQDYIGFIKKYIDFSKIKNSRINLLVDYMYGSGSGYFDKLLKGTKCNITSIQKEYNPLFGGNSPEPIPKNLRQFLKTAKDKKPHLGIALDGDADRIAACDENGNYLNSGQIMSLILLHFLQERKLKGIVVKTISGTNLIEKIAQDFGLELIETPIGFKHISKLMLNKDILIGGEESGGIGFKGYMPERDGIVSGLFLLEMVATRQKSIGRIMKDVNKKYGNFCYSRVDIKMSVKAGKKIVENLKKTAPSELLGKPIEEVKDYDGIKFILKDKAWLLIRQSGTEPILRIYAESASNKEVMTLLNTGKRLALKWNKVE